jgi:hypothetical protein
MTKIIYESNFKKLIYDQHTKELNYILLETTSSMRDDEYQKEILKTSEVMEQYDVQYVLIDFRNFDFIIVPELQDWMTDTIAMRWQKMNIKKIGMVMPQDLVVSLAIEQMANEVESHFDMPFRHKFFEDVPSVLEWFTKSLN